MNSIEVAVTATGAAVVAETSADSVFAVAFLGFFATGALVSTASTLLAEGFLAFSVAGFSVAAFLAAGFFSTGGFATAFFAAGFLAVFGSTASELFSFTISGALQAVSLSGHTHRI
jgi:hypothetical protein